MKKLTLILMVTYSLMLLSVFDLNAQVDQTFWFVAPETTRSHLKTPGVLRITAFENEAVVRISQPANSDFEPILITVPANSQVNEQFHDYGLSGQFQWVNGIQKEIFHPLADNVPFNQMLWSIENGTLDAIKHENGDVMVHNGITLNHDWHGFTMDADNNPVVSGSHNIPKFNKGLLIESTNGADISVYYEVANENNPERFNLKGSNALGTKFLIPSQNLFYNHYTKSREKVDIVATEDNTQITINFDPAIHDFVGKPAAGNSFTISLNRGQTFSLRCSSRGNDINQKGKHLGGIFIESNENIAITISDDSIREYEDLRVPIGNNQTRTAYGHWDLVGDQLIPINIAGTKYIAMHPSFGTQYEEDYGIYFNMPGVFGVSNQVFIWPVSETAGKIYINGVAISKDGISEFKRGDFYVANIDNNGIFIEADYPVLVYQIPSYAYEMGSAVLPALECTGSKQVSFARVYTGHFFVQILTKGKYVFDENGNYTNSFEVFDEDGVDRTNLVFGISAGTSEGWTKVPTEPGLTEGEEWYSFTKLANGLSTTKVITVKFKDAVVDPFDRLFHLSVLDANGSSMSFGYFSAYNALSVAPPGDLCIANGIELSTTAANASWYYRPNPNSPPPLSPFAENTSKVLIDKESEYKEGAYWVVIPGLTCGISEEVNIEFNIPEFDLGEDRIACPGEVVELEIEALSEPADYNWYVNDVLVPDNNSNSYSFVATANTNDTIKLEVITKGDLPCSQSGNVVITVGQQTIPDVDLIPDVVCAGATLTTEAREGLTYEWVFPNGTTSSNTYITPTEEGLYTLTVSNGNSACDYVKEIDLTIHELPEVTLDPVMACIGVDGELIPNITSTATPYTLLWKVDDVDVSTSSTLTLSQPSENIVVEVTDANGCMADTSASFGWYAQTLFEQPEIIACYAGTIVERIDTLNQFNNFVWTYEADPSDPASTKVALTPPNQIAVERELTITVQDEGDVIDWAGRYHVKADDFNGCPVEGYFDLIITPPPVLDFIVPELGGPTNDPRMCQGDSIRIIIDDPHKDLRTIIGYSWDYTDGTIVQEDISQNSWITANVAGTYFVEVTMANNCNAIGQVEVDMVDAPIFEMSDQVACPETDIVLGMTPGTYISNITGETIPDRYEWLQAVYVGMEITDQIPVIGTDATYSVDGDNRESYRLTVFNSQGCFASEFATASSHDLPHIELTDEAICLGQDFLLSISESLKNSGGQYSWYAEGQPAPPFYLNEDLLVSPTAVGTYTYNLIFETAQNCLITGSMTLTVLSSPEFTLPTGAICEGETISITAKDSYESYVWGGNGVADANTFQVDASGVITLVVRDENGCETSATTNLTVRPLPLVTLDGARICPGETTTLSVPFDPADYNILWTSRNSTVGRNINEIQAGVGPYSVTVAYVDDSNCAGSAQVVIEEDPIPKVFIGDNISGLCPADLPIEIVAQQHESDLSNWENILWHDGLYENMRVRLATLGAVNVVHVRNNYNCRSRADITVKTALPTLYDAGRDVEGCEPTDGMPFAEELYAGEFTLYEGSADEPIETLIQSYRWFEANDPSTTLGTHHTFTATASGQYLVEVFDGCWPDTATFNIDLYPNPTIAGIDSTIYRQVVVFAEGGTEPYAYALNDRAPQNDRTFKNLSNGDYTVYVIDNHGCEASISFLFESSYDIKVPNFFTPNGDGFNDTWVIEGIEKLPESIIYIYDRFGKLLKKYGTNDPTWNGHYLNQPVPSDDYWYVIHLLPVDKFIRGNFTLKR